MGLNLVVTDKATEMLVSISLFIEQKWSLNQAEIFLTKCFNTFEKIKKQPYIFKASTFDQSIRVGNISKQCAFFYQVSETEITILFMWDNRQEPIF